MNRLRKNPALCFTFPALVLIAGGMLCGSAALGGDKTWDNGDTNLTWDTATSTNWSGSTWTSYDNAFFAGAGTGTISIVSGGVLANKLNFTADGYTIAGPGTLSMGDPGTNDNFNVDSGVTASISAVISQNTDNAFQKIGAGTLILSGNVTTSGGGNNRVDGGTLKITGGTFDAGGSTIWIADSSGTTGTLEVAGGTFTTNTNGTVATRGTGTLNITGGTANFNGGLQMGYSGIGSSSKSAINLSSGTLAVGSGGSGNFILGNSTSSGATSVFTQTGGTFTFSGSNLYIGNWGAGTQTLSVSGGTFGSTTSSMRLGIRGTADATVSGTGQVTLPGLVFGHSGTSGETGNFNLDGGTLTINSGGVTNDGATAANFNFNGGTLKASANFSMGGLTAATVKSNGAIIDTDGNNITMNQALLAGSPSGGLTKNGAGILTLAATGNTYSGNTTVNAGTLRLNGTHTGGGTFTIGDGTGTDTLDGTGSTNAAVIVSSAGVLAPGNSIESLGTGALTFNNGSTFEYDLDSTSLNGDLVIADGNLTINDTSTLTLNDTAPGALALNSKLTLIDYNGSWSGAFQYLGNPLADGATFTLGANTWRIDYNDATGGSNFSGEQSGSTFVTLTVVPEPGSFAILLLGLAGLGFAARRRR